MTQFVLFLNELTGEGIIHNVSDISYIRRVGNKIFVKAVSGNTDIEIHSIPEDVLDNPEQKKTLSTILGYLDSLTKPVQQQVQSDAKVEVEPVVEQPIQSEVN